MTAHHGYRFAKSTIASLVASIEEIMHARDHQESVEIKLCDMSKAFDTVSHDIWSKSRRTQTVEILPCR